MFNNRYLLLWIQSFRRGKYILKGLQPSKEGTGCNPVALCTRQAPRSSAGVTAFIHIAIQFYNGIQLPSIAWKTQT